MPVERFCLDANVLFYSMDSAATGRQEVAARVIDQAAQHHDCIIPFQALTEFFAATVRKGKLASEEAAQQIRDWQILFPTAYPRTGILPKALDVLQRHQLSFWDSLIWAVARDAGVTVLLTEDHQDGRELGGVVFRNPFSGEDPFRPSRGTSPASG